MRAIRHQHPPESWHCFAHTLSPVTLRRTLSTTIPDYVFAGTTEGWVEAAGMAKSSEVWLKSSFAKFDNDVVAPSHRCIRDISRSTASGRLMAFVGLSARAYRIIQQPPRANYRVRAARPEIAIAWRHRTRFGHSHGP